jgi:hypothetical protein
VISRRLSFRRTCVHEHVIAIHSAGVMRVICEDCGHISFSFDESAQVLELDYEIQPVSP